MAQILSTGQSWILRVVLEVVGTDRGHKQTSIYSIVNTCHMVVDFQGKSSARYVGGIDKIAG